MCASIRDNIVPLVSNVNADSCDLRESLESIKQISNTQLPVVLSLLNHSDAAVVKEAIYALARSNRVDSVDAIWNCKCKKDELVRVAIIESAEALSDKSHEKEMRFLLTDSSRLVRSWAATAYATLYPQKAQFHLKKLLSAERFYIVKVSILIGLYSLGEKGYLYEVFGLLKHRSYIVRHAAANSIEFYIRKNDTKLAIAAIEKRIPRENNKGVKDCFERVVHTLRKRLD